MFFGVHTSFHSCGKHVGDGGGRCPFAGLFPDPLRLWITTFERLIYTFAPAVSAALPFSIRSHSLEAHLSAQRPPPQAQARLPRADVDARRTGDSQAPPRQGPQAALRLSTPDYPRTVQRRHRLSRSRDFDAVYRSGRSASTRFLVLYWFPRPRGRRVGRASPRPGRPEVGRERRRPQPGQAPAARDLDRAGRTAHVPVTTTCSSPAPAWPSRRTRAGTNGSPSA